MTPPLSVGELAQFLGMSTKWVYQQLAKGEIPACKIGGTWFIDRP
ncbi:MAG: helix-turn-helix domain-containing protein, partial [Candidatus Thorarchaeota archaeon]|nr:helix-turn-helix domain-containing protein [Candidatus Thorarchaeota archaeon]NIW13458.1 helix-turn-helix domain-containing protein [Candidatus Thorarchaeota archaeon]NIW51568.1 helix-turn-helix domain-containing protein [Candidatus Korarchaeota archaeon]